MDDLTCDGNSSCLNLCRYPTLCYMDLMFVIAITFLILIGNFGNLFVFLLTPSFRNGHGIILISLAIADFGTGIISCFSIYPMATFLVTPEAWPYGDTACKLTAYFGQVFITSSGTTLTFLAIERYIAIDHPFKYSRFVTKKVTLTCVVVSWVGIALAYVTTLTDVASYEYVPALHTCTIAFLGEPVLIAFVLFVILIPDIIIVSVTSCIVTRTLKSSDRIRANMAIVATTPSPSQPGSTNRAATSKKTLKLFQMVRVMTIAVLVSWLPYFCVAFLISVVKVELPHEILSTSRLLLVSNGFFNSVIYFLMNKTYHDRLDELCKKIIPRFCFRLNDCEIKTTYFCCTNNRGGIQENNDNIEHEGPKIPVDLEPKA